MTASLVLDERCRQLRCQLKPLPWMVLEEAALSSVESGGLLWAPLSVRSVAGSLSVGRESAARAIGALVSAGVLRRSETRRDGGRFGPGGYWLLAPPGLTVTGVHRSAVSGEPGAGGPCPVVPATVVVEGPTVTKDGRRGGGHRSHPESLASGQASLFAAGVGEEESGLVAAASTPRVGVESVGAVSSFGCGVVSGVHELAPGVPAGADPSLDPHPVRGGGGRC